jgi:hypothetical protein
MKAFLAVAVAHARTKWRLALVPITAGLVFQLLRTFRVGEGSNDFKLVAITVGVALSMVVAVLLGIDLVASDFRTRRLPFFLSRPLPLWQLWCGRFLGSLFVLAPAWLGGRMAIGEAASFSDLGVSTLLVFLLLSMNSVACVLASLSVDALGVDLVGAAVFAWIGYETLRRIADISGHLVFFNEGVSLVLPPLLAAISAGLFVAGLAFLAAGRGRRLWSHRVHAWTLWPIVLMSLGASVWAWHRQEMRTTLAEVLGRTRGRALDGERFLTFDWGRVYPRMFVVEAATGRSERVSAWTYSRVVSGDGTMVAWVREDMSEGQRLVIAKSDNLGQPLRELEAPKGNADLIDISNRGERALFGRRGSLEVWDAVSGKNIATVKTNGRPALLARFTGDRELEAEFWEDTAIRRVSFGFDGAVIAEQRIERPFRAAFSEHEGTGRRAVVEGDFVVLRDRDGGTVATVKGKPPSFLMTRSGALLVWAHGTLTIIGVDDPTPRVLPVSGITGTILGELESGEVVIRTFEKTRDRSVVVDPRTANVILSLDGVRPIRDASRPLWGPVESKVEVVSRLGLGLTRSQPNRAEDTILRVFQNDDGDLLYLDRGARTLRLLVKSTRAEF